MAVWLIWAMMISSVNQSTVRETTFGTIAEFLTLMTVLQSGMDSLNLRSKNLLRAAIKTDTLAAKMPVGMEQADEYVATYLRQ